jgi:hypothetical protein
VSIVAFSYKGTMLMPPDDGVLTDIERRNVRNWIRRMRKLRASGKPKGRRTDIPLTHIEAARIRFSASDGTVESIEHVVVPK